MVAKPEWLNKLQPISHGAVEFYAIDDSLGPYSLVAIKEAQDHYQAFHWTPMCTHCNTSYPFAKDCPPDTSPGFPEWVCWQCRGIDCPEGCVASHHHH